MSKKKEIDEISGTETTGHEWDGIKELNTPLPRWWLGIFYATIVWAIGYWIVYAGLAAASHGYTHGLLDHSQRDEVTANVAALKAARAAREARTDQRHAWQQIQANPDLQQFAMAEGKSTFGDNCAPCHGSGGQGAHGYPNLNDDVWLWGGKLEDIQHTITVGVRSTSPRHAPVADAGLRPRRHPEAGAGRRSDRICRASLGPARRCGRGAPRRQAVRATIAPPATAPHGKGNRDFGAPNLTDNEWLYGAEPRGHPRPDLERPWRRDADLGRTADAGRRSRRWRSMSTAWAAASSAQAHDHAHRHHPRHDARSMAAEGVDALGRRGQQQRRQPQALQVARADLSQGGRTAPIATSNGR